jgi:hypothetical protein
MGTIAKNRYWIDLKLFDSKVSIVTDYFTDTRKDLLIRDILYQELLGYAPGELFLLLMQELLKIQVLNFL